MYDSMLHLQMQEACMQLNRGYEVNWGAMPLSGVFETTDGACAWWVDSPPTRWHEYPMRWTWTRT